MALPLAFAAGRISADRPESSPRVKGIGGVFFKSQEPAALRAWYNKHFGMPVNGYGALFEFKESLSGSTGYLQWSPFNAATKYFAPSTKEFMINYRVEGIEALLEKLRADNVIVCDTIETFEYGKFVHVMDPEGNKLELWEPIDSGFGAQNEGSTVK